MAITAIENTAQNYPLIKANELEVYFSLVNFL